MDTNQLQIITDDTVKEVRKLDIVIPELYKDIFYQKAKDKKIDIYDLDKNEFAVSSALTKIEKIQKETERNTSSLIEQIDLAKVAINHKDEKSLNQVEGKLLILQQRILQLEMQIYIDELTKVYNRKWLYEKFLDYDKFKNNGTLIFMDINSFKSINDTYGHIIGDKILFMISNMFSNIEKTDIIRYGGDEFVMIFNDISEKNAVKFFEKKNSILKNKILRYRDNSFKITISYGVKSFKSDDYFNDIVDIADQNMYKYKRKIKEESAVTVDV